MDFFPSQLDPPRTPPTRDSFHPELAGLQYKPLPLPPAMLDGQCDRARQPYIEWSSESEDGNDARIIRPNPPPVATVHSNPAPPFLVSPPALSSAGSSSTRSSAYTSSGSAMVSGDYSHVHVASGDDQVPLQMDYILSKGGHPPLARRVSQRRVHPDQNRWSESYSSGIRSRSSSLGNNSSYEASSPNLKEKPSYDMGWIADEKDETGLTGLTDDETDDDQPLTDDHDPSLDEERTSAALIADEGRGLIVQADSTPIVHLQVQPGTTHLLMGSSTTPNAVPVFLSNTLPQICHSLLALDISANFLGFLPPVLAICTNLEELNVASNPLRVLPVFLADLINLRVFIADSTGIVTLPDAMADLDKLHTISIRRNKLHALPSWLCMLPALQTLYVDNNPFQGPWKALVEPLLSKTSTTTMDPPSIRVLPLAAARGPNCNTDDASDSGPVSTPHSLLVQTPEDEDQTITPDRAPHLGQAVTSPLPVSPQPPRTLSRTRTTPNRTYFEQTRANSGSTKHQLQNPPPITLQQNEHLTRPELRKMKSAGDLRKGKLMTAHNEEAEMPPLSAKTSIATSQSSTNLAMNSVPSPALSPNTKRYGSLGPASSIGSPIPRPNANVLRSQFSQSLWEKPSESAVDTSSAYSRTSLVSSSTTSPQPPSVPTRVVSDSKALHRSRPSKDGKEKNSRWGFLKKMSMGKMKVEPVPPLPPNSHPNVRPTILAGASPIPDRFSRTPQLDVRLSTSGSLDAILPPSTPPQPLQTPSLVRRQLSTDLLRGMPSIASTNTLVSASTFGSSIPASVSLAPPATSAPTSRTGKRRSFLPIDAPTNGGLNIPIPDNLKFMPDITAMGEASEDATLTVDARVSTPSPIMDPEQYQRKEEERAREAYTRALRSVMAYLKDMNDLSLSSSQQLNPLSMYGQAPDEMMTRSRRMTTTSVADNLREVSIALSGTTIAPSTTTKDGTGQLRPVETIVGLRSGSSSQTMSVVTTDSNSSQERKYKDDKGKRAMVIKEILLTERTYVKGLRELVDIYIKPGSVPVNILSGVSSSKETVVPISERKIVFGGLEALFSFHSESFLPALERACAPMMKLPEQLEQADADGQLSMNVARAVGEIFLKHAAFMKMYSSYINNFDNSVQRVKYWTSVKQAPSIPPSAFGSPSSSTTQLVALGLGRGIVPVSGVAPDAPGAGLPNLSTSQRKRLKSYLKRCRMNPRHTQLNLEGYLLLPVQRIPRYRLLLEELLRTIPPYVEDPLERALTEISSLATNMNEGKRESESRHKLVQWQARIRGKFPSPLVQPHRRLIMCGVLILTRVVRKAVVSFDTINAHGDAAAVQVDCLAPELTPRPLIGILCNDLLVLCRDPSYGQDPTSQVDLWAVLRMQTLPQPASIVHGNVLRLVDNKAILYFDVPSPSDALSWYRAINLHIPASKT